MHLLVMDIEPAQALSILKNSPQIAQAWQNFCCSIVAFLPRVNWQTPMPVAGCFFPHRIEETNSLLGHRNNILAPRQTRRTRIAAFALFLMYPAILRSFLQMAGGDKSIAMKCRERGAGCKTGG